MSSQDIHVEITRFVPYDGPKGNALAFADVEVHTAEGVFAYPDVKLYRRGKAGLFISPKQSRTDRGWAYDYAIPDEFEGPIRSELIKRLELERTGQQALL